MDKERLKKIFNENKHSIYLAGSLLIMHSLFNDFRNLLLGVLVFFMGAFYGYYIFHERKQREKEVWLNYDGDKIGPESENKPE